MSYLFDIMFPCPADWEGGGGWWWSGRHTGSRWTRRRPRSGRCGRTQARPGSLRTGAWLSAGNGTGRSASGTRPRNCTSCGTRRRKPTRLWPGGRSNSKCTYQEAFRNLDRALRDFTDSRKGKRKGKRLGFPRKKKGKCRDSFRFGAGVMRCAGARSRCPASARSRPMSRRANSPVRSRRAPPASFRLRFPDGAALVRLVHRRSPAGRPGGASPARHRGRNRPRASRRC